MVTMRSLMTVFRSLHSVVRGVRPWLPALAWAGLIFFLSDQPPGFFPRLGVWERVLPTAAHLVIYAVLMVWLMMALRRGTRLGASRARWLAFALVALYALSDEYHQTFVPGRTATLADWLADMAGAGLAWWGHVRWERG